MDRDFQQLIKKFRERPRVGVSGAPEVLRQLIEGMAPLGDARAADARESDLARFIDHTALKPETSLEDIANLCREAVTYSFASVCVNPCYVPVAARLLSGSEVAVCTVVGFPLGAAATQAKAREAEDAVKAGALEVDMVMNVGMLKSGEHDYVEADIRSVVEAVGGNLVTKVILETALLSDHEKVIASVLAQSAGADFVKTSTGFSSGGATLDDVALMRRVVGAEMGVKASGGVRTAAQARAMIEAGASRIGASSSVEIVRGEASGSSDY